MAQAGETSANDVLAPEAVLSILDTNIKFVEEEGIVFGSSQDALAALFHSIMQAVGFRLVGLSEDDGLKAFLNI